MKRIFWLFRTNLRNLEYYHAYKNSNVFKEKCHDFYLLQGIWFLENDIFDEVIIWRLQPKGKNIKDIIFNINGKLFIQRFVKNFNECFNYEKPMITFFRGGFRDYCDLIRKDKKFFGRSLYLGAGKRIYPIFGGVYDKILIESEKDENPKFNTIPFYKTSNQNIFKPLNLVKKYDICWICNFTQIKQKGQGFFINEISKSNYLKKIRIVHIGNEEKLGKKLCDKYNVYNIEFLGKLEREKINEILNQSKIGIVTSNKSDGCPRISTEILSSGTPLLIRDQTRLLDIYKTFGVVQFNDKDLNYKTEYAFKKYEKLKKFLLSNFEIFDIDNVCKNNLKLWFE